jgi:uncharacterized protein YxjI
MNLYIKQKIFSWADKFSVYDADGNEKYYVEGGIFSFGKKLHLYDASGTEIAYIEQQLFSFLPRYIIYKNGRELAEVVKRVTFFVPEYSVNISGTDTAWTVRGDFFDHDYEVTEREDTIAAVNKEWFTFGDAYEISIGPGADEITALAVVLVIDACIEAQKN